MWYRMRAKLGQMLGVMLLIVAGATGAWADCALPDMRTGDRPPPSAAPTEVSVAAFILDFLGVNDLDQSIELDVRTVFSWQDPRLAGLDGCRFGLDQVWFPPVLLANSSNLREAFRMGRNRVTVGPGGQVTYVQRYTGTISSYHHLQRFPFDRQAFEITLLSPDLGPDELRLVADHDGTGISEQLNIEGWNVAGVGIDARVLHFPAVGRDLSQATLTIHADRNPTYYVFRVLLPLVFVVAMSWVIFWVPPERFEFQIGIGATSMLTTIAFSLSIAGKLPDLGYLTVMDKMLIWAVFIVFLSMAEALVAGLMVLRGDEGTAHRLDRWSRLLGPLLLAAGWVGFAM